MAGPILVHVRAMPMVLTKRSMRCFRSTKTCSIIERILERAAVAFCRLAVSGLPGARRRWTFETSPAAIRFALFRLRWASSSSLGPMAHQWLTLVAELGGLRGRGLGEAPRLQVRPLALRVPPVRRLADRR
ncbi:MAG: hypothetical protein AAF844_19715, partial [Pseudomonadota bacterium]